MRKDRVGGAVLLRSSGAFSYSAKNWPGTCLAREQSPLEGRFSLGELAYVLAGEYPGFGAPAPPATSAIAG